MSYFCYFQLFNVKIRRKGQKNNLPISHGSSNFALAKRLRRKQELTSIKRQMQVEGYRYNTKN